MSDFVGDWQKLKAKFDETGLNRPTRVKETMFGTMKMGTGISGALREIDTAIGKKERAPLAQAINKFLAVRDPFCKICSDRALKANADGEDEAAAAYASLNGGLQKIAVQAAEELKKIQIKKGGAAVPMIEIEGDVKATVMAAHRSLAGFAALEKKHKVMETADAAAAETVKYTKAAARGDYTLAIQALTRFKAAAKKAADDLKSVMDKEKSSSGFTEAVKKFEKGMRDFSTVQRVDGAIKAMRDAQ
jgi:hypothetical protein